jgi:hypothetical protein
MFSHGKSGGGVDGGAEVFAGPFRPRRWSGRRRRDRPAEAELKLNCLWKLSACAEGDDAALRVVRRNPNRHAVAWNDFDAKPPHPTAKLRKYFMSRIDLHPVQTAAMDCDDGALHIDQIVFAHKSSLLIYWSLSLRSRRKVCHGLRMISKVRAQIY